MSDEDFEAGAFQTEETAWFGTAIGGPLDGATINVGSAPHIPMRDLHVSIRVGEKAQTANWHVYAYRSRLDEERMAPVHEFRHIGLLESDPKIG
jgi:hypothetical protein